MAETSEIALQAVLDSVLERGLKHMGPGKVATYIPALARVPADKAGHRRLLRRWAGGLCWRR